MPLPPLQPKRPGATRGNTAERSMAGSGRRPATRAKAAAPAPTPAAPQGPPQLPLHIAAAVSRDEEATREDIVRQEQLGYCALTLQRNDSAVLGLQLETETLRRTVADFSAVSADRDSVVTRLDSTLDSSVKSTAELFEKVTRFIDHSSSTDAARLKELERSCAVLTHELEQRTAELDRVRAENRSLQNTVNRRLLRAEIEHDALRDEVRAAIETSKLDFDKLKQQIFQRVDGAVLQYHKPQFESALESLREYQDKVTKEVDEHTTRLRGVIDSIGSSGMTVEVKSMHSQIPPEVRRELEHFNKDQLLNLVDVLSFEDGVVAGVARAVARSRHHETQAVF